MRPSLDGFKQWMVRRGRSERTADLYIIHLNLCRREKKLASRLLSKKLSPNTKRTILAALRAWGKYSGDGALLDELGDIRLPAAARVVEKRPLERDEWDRFSDAVETIESAEMRAAVRMICARGFRVGDVCRITREQVRQALDEGVLVYEAKANRYLSWGTGLYHESLEELASARRWNRIWDLLAPNSRADIRWRAGRLNLSRTFPDLCVEAGLKPGSVTPHRLRRTYAVHFLKATGGDLAALQQHMGWASMATALKYVDHTRSEELDDISLKMRGR